MEVEMLISALHNETDVNIRKYIPDKLAKLNNTVALPHLQQILLDSTAPYIVRNECAEALGKFGTTSTITALSQVVHDSDPELRRTAIWALGQIGDESVVSILHSCMGDSDSKCRKWIAKSLARVESPLAFTVLFEYYTQFSADEYVKEALWGFGKLVVVASPEQLTALESLALKEFAANSSVTQLPAIRLLSRVYSVYTPSHIPDFKFSQYSLLIQQELVQIFGQLSQYAQLLQLYQHYINLQPQILYSLAAHNNVKLLTSHIEVNDFTDRHWESLFMGIFHALSSGYIVQYDYMQVPQQYTKPFILLTTFGDAAALLSYAQQYPIPVLIGCQNFPYNDSVLQFLFATAQNGTKVQRELVIAAIKKFCNATPLPKTKEILYYMIQNDKIWHIRRDARKLLIFCFS